MQGLQNVLGRHLGSTLSDGKDVNINHGMITSVRGKETIMLMQHYYKMWV
jgi:hypothetical protein